MVAMASRGSAKQLLRIGSRIAGKLASDWFAVYVETPKEEPGRIKPEDHAALEENIRFAERLGARVVLAGTTTADRMQRALEIARQEGSTMVPPYDDPLIIAGQGTVGLEIVEDAPQTRTVLVPVGGGGLSAGVATAVKLLDPSIRVIGIEPAGAPKLSRARAAGAPVRLSSTAGLADGLLAVEIGGIPFAHHQKYIDDVVTVDDSALRGAMRFLLDRMKIVAEPSGAITVAALLEGLVRPAGPTVAVLSGGNIEWAGLLALLGDA
jgi:threonine dehydratase